MNKSVMIGTQLVATEGYLSLEVNVVYYFLCRNSHVRLVYFLSRESRRISKNQRIDNPLPYVKIIDLSGDLFDYGMDQDLIKIKDYQDELPNWIVSDEDACDEKYKRSRLNVDIQNERVKKKIKILEPLLIDFDEIVKSSNPIKYLNAYAKSCTPQQNQQRLHVYFFSYVLFKRDNRVVGYRTANIGKWSRTDHQGKKSGNKSLGIGGCLNSKSTDSELIEDIKNGWEKWGQYGESIRSIYSKVCAEIWNPKILTDKRGMKTAVRPNGKSIISYYQFLNRLKKLIGDDEINRKLRGRAFFRESRAESRGSFTEDLSCIGQRVEADGYWYKNVIIGPDGRTPLPALIIVRIKCVFSGMILGVGFSLSGEKSDAYRMAQFCMSIPKSLFGEYFGVKISDENWPTIGVSDSYIADRGVGSTAKAEASIVDGLPIVRGMPPAGFGQGKAVIESSHPRNIKASDRDCYMATSLNVIDVMRKVIENTVAENDSADMSSRVTPSMLPYLDRFTPLGIFSALSPRGRNSLRPISTDSAIRSYLTPITVSVKGDGVYYKYQKYTSQDFQRTGLMSQAAASGVRIELSGYAMDMSLRYIHVEYQGKIFKLAAKIAIHEDDEQLYISLEEMEIVDNFISQAKSDLRIHSVATKIEGHQRFVENTGSASERVTVRPGSPKRRTSRARDQARSVQKILSSKPSSK